MPLGKQITTYLRGSVAEAYEAALKERNTSSYALLLEAVTEYLQNRGYATRKGRIIPVTGIARQRYEEEIDRRAEAILQEEDLAALVVQRYTEGKQVEEAPPRSRARRRRRTLGTE